SATQGECAMLYPALQELMKDDLDARWQEGRLEGRKEGRLEGRKEGIFGAVGIYRDEMGLDDETIMGKIAARFHLTAEQAAEYVRLSQEL
ncbi:MAG: hypothetical protein IJR48_02720, partial [Oscillibacter sp.]|nr:hypothetical protein [Oscillibacter sp.]